MDTPFGILQSLVKWSGNKRQIISLIKCTNLYSIAKSENVFLTQGVSILDLLIM